MQNETVATTRTVFNTTLLTWLGAVIYKLFDLEIEPEVLIAVFPVGIGIFHRASLVLSEIWPPVGYILFGIPRTPTYDRVVDV